MKCKYCGNDIPEDAKFCPMCGGAQEAGEPEGQTGAENTRSFDGGAAQAGAGQTQKPDGVYVQTSYSDQKTANGAAPAYNGMAIAGFVLAFFFPVLGLIFSAIGMSQCNQRGDNGKGLAIAGLVISIVVIAIWIIVWGSVACVGCATYRYW